MGDFMWVILTKDHFPVGEYNKLSAKKIEPVEIVGYDPKDILLTNSLRSCRSTTVLSI